MKDMRITIIGGSGFVGTRLIELLKVDHQVKNLDKNPSHFFNDLTTLSDVRDIDSLRENLKNTDIVVLLAAEHRDDVSPTSLYYDVNVEGMRNTLSAMESNGIKRLIFTSSVAVYGLNKSNPDETHPTDPFNHYGKSKWAAEEVLQAWYASHPDWNVDILRPTVIFGERNRGNVYNLLSQISGGKFLMIGSGNNKKSMAYVGNIVAFIEYCIQKIENGYNVYNYVDKPDFSMNELVSEVSKILKKKIPSVHFPYWLGLMGGYCFDLLAKITGKKLPISSVRITKFCATTQFSAYKVHQESRFKAPYQLSEGLERTLKYEFIRKANPDDILFYTE